MKIVKLAVEECIKIEKKSDGTPLYVVKCLSNRGRDKNGDYLKDVALYTDENTYKAIDEGKDVILRFTSDRSVKGWMENQDLDWFYLPDCCNEHIKKMFT